MFIKIGLYRGWFRFLGMVSLVDMLRGTDLGKPGTLRIDALQMVAHAVQAYVGVHDAVTNSVLVNSLQFLVRDPDYVAAGRSQFWSKSNSGWDLSRFTNVDRNNFLAAIPHIRMMDAARSVLQKRGFPVDVLWRTNNPSSFSRYMLHYHDDDALERYVNAHFRMKRVLYEFKES